VVPATAARGFAVLSDASFNTCASRTTARAARWAGGVRDAGFNLADAEANDRGELWLCDRTPANPGVRMFDVATLAPLAGPLSTGLPPLDIEFDGSATVDVPATGGPAPLAFAGAWPNPRAATS